jgi:hypothetical protein
VARSNIWLLNTMGARVRVVAPRTLLPAEIERLGVEVFHDMAEGLAGVDIVMMLRLQSERMHSSFVPSTREYFHFFGLDYDKLRMAKPDALIMHPGPMNRGVEIGSEVADDIDRSLIRSQVEMGVAVHMACLEILTHDLGNGPPGTARKGREPSAIPPCLAARPLQRPMRRPEGPAFGLQRSSAVQKPGSMTRRTNPGNLTNAPGSRPSRRSGVASHGSPARMEAPGSRMLELGSR